MAGIENLGAYGQLTKAAKAAGGVEKLIASLESTAVSRAAVGLRAQGIILGALGASTIGFAHKYYQRKKQANVAAQEAVRAELREVVDAEECEQDDETEG